MTAADFEAGITRLSLLRGVPEDVSPFWDLFGGVASDEWAAGIDHAIKTRTFFPVPAELFEDCEQARPRRAWQLSPPEHAPDGYLRTETITCPLWPASLSVNVYREWKYYCERCSDSGWVSNFCGGPPPKPWQLRTTCSVRDVHGPHDWSSPCPCALTNPAVQIRRETIARAALSGGRK